jgi:hypothetical protein
MKRQAAVIAATVLATVAACEFVGSDYVPSEQIFRDKVGTFIVPEAVNLVPFYGNIDVNSMFGTYVVNGKNRDAVFAEIMQRAARAGWTVVPRSSEEYEFHRAEPGTVPRFEVARVVCTEPPLTVHVAWLQVHYATTLGDSAETAEGQWAEREFWPRFERTLK